MNCLSCLKRYRSISEYHDHIKSHRYDNNLQLKCYFENCGMIFTKLAAYFMHTRRHHSFAKKKSDQISPKKQHGNRLFEILAANGVVECTMCPEPKLNFTKKSTLRMHIFRNHKHDANGDQHSSKKLDCNISQIEFIDFNDSSIQPFNESSIQPFSECSVSPKYYVHTESNKFSDLFLKLRANHGTTEAALMEIQNEVEINKVNMLQSISHNIDTYCKGNHLENHTSALTSQVQKSIEAGLDTSDVSTVHRMNKTFKSKNFVAPEEIELVKDGKIHKFHYTPVLQTLNSLLKDSQFVKRIFNPTKTNIEGKYSDYRDGTVYKQNSFWSECVRLELLLYQDGTELVNPIGSGKGRHKMLGVYFSIGNLPYFERVKKENLQTLIICKEKTVKVFGFAKLLERALLDLKHLETVGVSYSFGGENKIIKGSLATTLGDNLGSHAIGGFLENFSTTPFFCRYCLITRFDWLTGREMVFKWRNRENYFNAISQLTDGKHVDGIKSDSCLNQLQHYHVVDPGLPPCLGHDLFEGIIRDDLPVIIEYFVKKKIFTYNQLNIEYDLIRKKLKCKVLPTITRQQEKLPGTADQNKNFLFLLPFVMLDKVFDRSSYPWLMFQSLLELTRICNTSELSAEQIILLDGVIEDFFVYRKLAFPLLKSYPKLHYLKHYPELIKKFGPLRLLWTLPYEHKHQFYKLTARKGKNFKNPTKTLSERNAMQQKLNSKSRFKHFIICNRSDLADISFDGNNLKFETKSVNIRGYQFCTNNYVVISRDDQNVINVMKISNIYLTNDYTEVFFYGPISQMWFNYVNGLYESFGGPDGDTKYINSNNILSPSAHACYIDGNKQFMYFTSSFFIPLF
jgi:hypothetical protein